MKQMTVVTLLALALISCKDDHDGERIPVHVALHHQFEEDYVVVKIDEKVLINGVASTNPSLGLSYVDGKSSAGRELSKGVHRIEVLVNSSVVHTTAFELTHTTYIGISFDPTTSAISFLYQDEPFMYD